MNKRVQRILLIEDNPGDIRLITEALRLHAIEFDLEHYEKATDAVRAVGRYRPGSADLPDLILVDYNVPCGDARDILRAAANNQALNDIPRAVLTSSLAPQDRENALQLGAHAFIYKPANLDDFLSKVGNAIAGLLSTHS
jgi:CheY-like chemotaxis protein